MAQCRNQCHEALNTNIIMSQCIGNCHEAMNMNLAQADFSLNLLRQNGFNSSTIFSPISITIALAMMFLGAKENTAAQIRNTIAKGVSGNDDEIHEYFSTFLNYSKKFKNINLESANRIYVGNDFEIHGSYIDGIKKFYNGEFEQINFNKTSEAADKINKFVAKSTHDKFQNFIDPNSIDPLTRMISINAIYFKANWAVTFWEEHTFDRKFFSSPNKNTTVKMMSHEFYCIQYFENDEFQIIGMPYKNYEATMYILLPREKFGLEKIVQTLNSTILIEALTNTVQQNFIINLPRFEIETSLNLVEALKKLGIVDAFDFNAANFSGITKNEKILVSKMYQKAFIKTDENGSEAAAATGIFYIPQSRRKIKTITMNHPFLFIIADKNFNFLFTGTFFG